MVFDILKRRRPVRTGKPKDDYDRVIEVIEKFAPRKYAAEREMYYYNYRIMPLYAKPLMDLLRVLSQRHRLAEDEPAFTGDVLGRLKSFYDPRGRLSAAEIRTDEGLYRKQKEMYLFFYDRRDILRRNLDGQAQEDRKEARDRTETPAQGKAT